MLVYQRAMWLKTSWWYVSTDELKHWLRKRIVRQSLRLWSGPLSMVFLVHWQSLASCFAFCRNSMLRRTLMSRTSTKRLEDKIFLTPLGPFYVRVSWGPNEPTFSFSDECGDSLLVICWFCWVGGLKETHQEYVEFRSILVEENYEQVGEIPPLSARPRKSLEGLTMSMTKLLVFQK